MKKTKNTAPQLSPEARRLRAEYNRAWAKENRERRREADRRYWEAKAAARAAAVADQKEDRNHE